MIRHLLIGALFAIPLISGYALFTAQAAPIQIQVATVQTTPERTVSESIAQEPTEQPAATEVKPETTVAPVATAPAPVVAATPAPAVDRLIIPSVGINSEFVTVGLAGNGAVDVHPSLVGWWNGSAQPGNRGAAFFDGHTPGALTPLASISTGAIISVEKAKGQTLHYTVVYRETVAYKSVNMRKALSVYGGAREGLNLMTCAGTYIPSWGTTDQRLVVYAVRS
jgi:hypothetical protein